MSLIEKPVEGEVLGRESLEVDLWDNPFSSQRVTTYVPMGLSIREIVDASVTNKRFHRYLRVWVVRGDQQGEVPPEQWPHVRLKEGSRLLIKCVPHGGGGRKNILGIILTILVIVVAFVVAPMIAGAIFGAGATASQVGLVFSGLTMVGKALIGALIPPPKPSTPTSGVGNSTNRTYALTGSSNRVAAFEAVPRVYGRVRMFPPLAGVPYNEVIGGTEVFQRLLFDFGPGPLKISEIKIGDTPIERFDGVEIEVGHVGDLNGNQPPAGVYYAGFSDDTDLKLYPNAVVQTNESVKIESGDDVIRNFPPSIVDGRVVTAFPRGLIHVATTGQKKPIAVPIRAHYREVGTSTWHPMIPGTVAGVVDVDLYPSGYEVIGNNGASILATLAIPPNWDDADYLSRYPSLSSWTPPYSTDGGTLVRETQPRGGRVPRPAGQAEYKIKIPKGWQHYTTIGAWQGYTPSWVNPTTAQFFIQDMKEESFYYGFRTPKLDVTKQYEFKLSRVYPEGTHATSPADVELEEWWLNSIQGFKAEKPVKVTGHALMALRIQSSEQLNGVLQNFSAKVEALLPVWNGSAWVANQVTRNPAWAFVDVLKGTANARPLADARLDLTTIKAFADWCDANNSKSHPRAYFDGVFDSRTTVLSALQQILAPQRASFSIRDGKYSIIWDDAKSTPVQLFTPKNSSGFSGKKVFTNPPHALRISFINEEKGYVEDELVVYADGHNINNATLFERLEAFGITRAEQAHWFGRYWIAVNLLRPEIYTIDVDVEGLVCRRGDLVRVQHDVPRWGIHSGRVRAIATSGSNVTSITLDETCVLESGKSYAIRGRKSNGTLVLANLQGVGTYTETKTLTLASPTPTGSMVAVGDLVAFGEQTKETIPCLVRSIQRLDDLRCRLELVDYSPDVFTSDTEEMPEFDTQSTWQGQGVTQAPAVPVVATVRSDEYVMIQTTNGYTEAVEITFRADTASITGPIRPDDYIEVRYGYDEGSWFAPNARFAGNPGRVLLTKGIFTGAWIIYQCRRVSMDGCVSDWSEIAIHHVVGRSTNPQPVSGFTAQVRADDVLLYWTRNIEKDILGYELRIGPTWATATVVEKSPTTITTQYVLPPQTAGSIEVLCRALDSFGLYSADDASALIVVTVPSTPSASYTFQGSNVVLTWADCQTSHRVSFYKVKRGTDAPIEIKTTSVQFPVNWTGNLAFEIWAVDVAGNESAHQNLTVSISAAGAPASFVHAIVADAVQLSWAASSAGSLPVSTYELRYGGTTWENATLIGQQSTTSLILTASWSGSRTFRIKARDTAGNYGAESTRAVNITVPASVVGLSVLSAGQYELSWVAPASLLPIKEYEIRHGASWATGTLVATVQALNRISNVSWTGTRSFWIVARTTTGLESTPSQIDVSITAPVAPALSSSFISSTLLLSWNVPSSALPVQRYEVRQGGTDWASSSFVAYADNTTFQTVVNWSGSRTYRVAAIDTGSNVGASASLDVTIVAPSAPQGLASDVVDNNVLLRWSPPALGTLPVEYYEVRLGASWASGTSLGNKDGTFTSHFQTASGTYTYWVCAFDTAGNEGTPASLSVSVAQPPDYILKTSFVSSLGGTLTNAVLDSGSVFMPVMTGETFQQHFDNNTWGDPQDQIDAGYPIYIQPTTTSDATYVETYDYGTTIPSANVTVTPTYETVAGSITWTGRIEVSLNGSSWTDLANPGWTGLATNFRYVRMTVKAVGAARTAVGKLSGLTLRIDLKQVTDSGVATCNAGDSGGTTVTFNRSFIDVDSIVVTPRSTSACIAVVDFTDTANPTSFKILVFDTAGSRVTKDVGWEARGV